MSVSLSPILNGYQSFLTNGLPNNGGFIYTYAAGTSTPTATYTTNTGGTPNANPIPLSADGRPPQEIWLTDGTAYKLVITDSLNSPIPSASFDNITGVASPGSITSFIASLAASTGGTLIGWIQSVAGAVLRTVSDKLTDQVTVFDFMTTAQIADVRAGTALVDVTAPLQAAANWLGSQTAPKRKLIFPSGRYKYTISPNWAIEDAEIQADGEVYLRYAGTGNAVICDGGSTGGVFNFKMGHTNKFIVEGPATSQNGVYGRALLQGCHIGFRITGAGTTYSGCRIEFAVCAKFDIICSSNGNGYAWYSKPAFGLYLTNRLITEPTSYCTFNTPILELTSGTGLYIDQAYGNVFIGGTAEQNASVGIYLTANAHENKFYGIDCEANTDHDVYCLGYHNYFYGLDTLAHFDFAGTAVNNYMIGGTHGAISIAATCANNVISGVGYNRANNGAAITDLTGGKTRLRDNINIGAGRVENAPPVNGIPVTIGASPFVFTNASVNQVDVVTTGTGINSISIVRNGNITPVSSTPCMITLSPADGLQLNYTAGTQIMTVFAR